MHVEIWSDIACPWCYVGKRRFEAALERFEHRDDVTVQWRSFELDPTAPAAREGDRVEHLAAKYGVSVEQARAMEARLTEAAAGDGIDMRLDIARGANTFDGHRLVHLAQQHGLQDAMKERLLRAYFTEGELVSDHATLARLAAEVGLDADEVAQALESGAYADAVRADERTAHELGITAVPFFVIDRAIGASGAHPPDALLRMLQTGWDRQELQVVAEGAACGPDGC
jgi:predicted DsbA family dithiol-disulfide isomerase